MQEIASSLSLQGNELILVSDSWLEVNRSDFVGNVNELSNDGLFWKRFYLDPVQMRYMNDKFIALFNICVMVINRFHPDVLLLVENLEYIYLLELIKHRYNIPCYITLFCSDMIDKVMYNTYSGTAMIQTIGMLDGGFTYPNYQEKLSKINSNIIGVNSSALVGESTVTELTHCRIFGRIEKKHNYYYLAEVISNMLPGYKKSVSVFGNDQCVNKLRKEIGGRADWEPITSIRQLDTIKAKREICISIESLYREDVVEELLQLYQMGFAVMVRKKNIDCVKTAYNVTCTSVGDDFIIIKQIRNKSNTPLISV